MVCLAGRIFTLFHVFNGTDAFFPWGKVRSSIERVSFRVWLIRKNISFFPSCSFSLVVHHKPNFDHNFPYILRLNAYILLVKLNIWKKMGGVVDREIRRGVTSNTRLITRPTFRTCAVYLACNAERVHSQQTSQYCKVYRVLDGGKGWHKDKQQQLGLEFPTEQRGTLPPTKARDYSWKSHRVSHWIIYIHTYKHTYIYIYI